MSLNQKFINYVAEKNIAEIRDWLWARLSTSFEMFEKEIKYCKSQGVDIYQPHDNRDVDLPATENSYNKLAGELKTNFSKERVNALIKIGRILYPREEPKNIDLHTTNTNTNTITHSSIESIEIEKKKSAGNTSGKFSISRVLWFLFAIIFVIFVIFSLIWFFGGFGSFETNTSSNESFWTNTSNW